MTNAERQKRNTRLDRAVRYRLEAFDECAESFLTIEDTAETLRMPRGTVSAWASYGEIETVTDEETGARVVLFNESLRSKLAEYRRPLREDINPPRKPSSPAGGDGAVTMPEEGTLFGRVNPAVQPAPPTGKAYSVAESILEQEKERLLERVREIDESLTVLRSNS